MIASRIFTSSYTKDCKLKEPCSMQKPTFLIKDLPKGEFFNYLEFEGNFYCYSLETFTGSSDKQIPFEHVDLGQDSYA